MDGWAFPGPPGGVGGSATDYPPNIAEKASIWNVGVVEWPWRGGPSIYTKIRCAKQRLHQYPKGHSALHKKKIKREREKKNIPALVITASGK